MSNEYKAYYYADIIWYVYAKRRKEIPLDPNSHLARYNYNLFKNLSYPKVYNIEKESWTLLLKSKERIFENLISPIFPKKISKITSSVNHTLF